MAKRRLGQIGALVRSKRGERGVREVAKEIKVSTATLSRVENGQQSDLNTFQKLCEWLGIDPSEFLDANGTGTLNVGSTPVTFATAHLKADQLISSELAQALGEMIIRAQAMMADVPDADHS